MQHFLVAALLLCVAHAQIVCETKGNVGTRLSLVETVVVNFGTTVTSTYSGNELARAFEVTFPVTNRPIFVLSATISGTNVTLTLRQFTTNALDPQTGAVFNVNYTDLGFASRFLSVGSSRRTSGIVCTTVDRVPPVMYDPYALSATGPTPLPIVIMFSESVSPCGGGSFAMSSFSTQTFVTSNTTLTPIGTPPTHVWYFVGDTESDYRAILAANQVCDSSGNPNFVTGDYAPLSPSSYYFWSAQSQTESRRVYDTDKDGNADLAFLTGGGPFNSTSLRVSEFWISVDGVNISNPQVVDDSIETDRATCVRFSNTAVSTSTTLARHVHPNAYFALLNTPFVGPASQRTVLDCISVTIVSVTGNMGSDVVTVTVSQPKSPSPPLSKFGIQSTFPFNISGSTGTPTLTSITLTLNDSIRSVAESLATKIYMVPEVYNADSQGFPLWNPTNINFTEISRAVVTRVGTGAWDTLTFTLVNSVSVDDVSTSVLSIQPGNGVTYTVESATRLSSTQVRYTVSQTCANSSVSCVDTSPDITYNLTIGSLSLTQLFTEHETAAPVFVGASAAIGSNKIRVITSEPVVGFSPSVAFTGVTVTAQSGTGSEYLLTLSRSIAETDLSHTWLETDLVDTRGNEATEAALVFSVKATVHDDEGDGTITRLRLTTNRPHAELSNSAAFATIPTMTLGAVTRVSSMVSDIAVTNGVPLGSSVSVEYLSHASTKLILSSDTRGGLEIPVTAFPAQYSTETVGPRTTSFSDLSTGLQAGIIAAIVGSLLMGILGTVYCKSTSRVKTAKRHRHELLEDVELDE